MGEATQPLLPLGQRLSLEVQWLLGRLLGTWLLWPLAVAWMRLVRRYGIRNISAVRRRFRELLRGAEGPLLVCPNHLTWIDSLLVQWALLPPWLGWRSGRLLVWNLPEKNNFTRSLFLRVVCYLGKCLPIARGGDRREQKMVLSKVILLMKRGEIVLVFPEGKRGRRGHIDIEEITYGVGALIREVPGCRVLCVYLRGDRQEQMSVLPRRGERFLVDMELIEPGTRLRGLRGHRDLSRQVAQTLCEMERRHFGELSS